MVDFLYAYNQGSNGSRELARALEIPRLKHTNSKFIGRAGKTILNWGSTELPEEVLKCRVINAPERVAISVNKLSAFNAFRDAGVSIPDFYTNRREALTQVQNGAMVFARTQLRAHSGNGIVIMDPDHEDTWAVEASLYVKYIPKKNEYRVHVMNGEVIDVQRKGLKEELRGREGINWKVQNLANGFIYVRNDGRQPPNAVTETALAAVRALGLDFGAVDVIWNERQGRAYALEINTAPGLVGTTVTSYRDGFRRHFA